MSLQSSPPRLPQWPFFLADAAFLAAACWIAESASRPLTASMAVLIAVCVAAAAVCGVTPLILGYAASQNDALDNRQRSLEALAQTVSTAAEQIGIAAAGLHEIADLAQKNLKHAEQLPHRIKEELTELEARVASLRADDREELERELATLRGSESERLEATADKIAKAAADWAKAESAGQRQTAAAKAFLAELDVRLEAVKSAAAELDARLAAQRPAAVEAAGAPPPAPPSAPPGPPGWDAEPKSATDAAPSKPTPPSTHSPAPASANGQASQPSPAAPGANPAVEAPKKRPVKKAPAAPHDDAPLFASSEPPVHAPKPGVPAGEFDQAPQGEAAQAPALSADGATRLLVTAYIGIGNRLFIRGDGPGLSWDEGVPLQFVSIGKWRWETAEATSPIHFKLLKNDRDPCASPSTPPPLEPGRQQELAASFA